MCQLKSQFSITCVSKHFGFFIWLQWVGILNYLWISCFIKKKKKSVYFPVCVKMSLSLFWALLITTGVVIWGHVQVKEVLQLPLQGLERGSVLFLLLPAVRHNVVEDSGAVRGARHPVAHKDLLHHLLVGHGWNDQRGTWSQIWQERCHFSNLYVQKIHLEIVQEEAESGLTWIRHLAKGHDLIQQNSKGPNIRFYSEPVLIDALWSSPLNRKLWSFFGFIHILTLFLETRNTHKKNTDRSESKHVHCHKAFLFGVLSVQ